MIPSLEASSIHPLLDDDLAAIEAGFASDLDLVVATVVVSASGLSHLIPQKLQLGTRELKKFIRPSKL